MGNKLRVGVYIDGANIYHGGSDAGWRVDYSKIRSYIERKHDIAAIIYFSCYGFERDSSGKYVRGKKGEYYPDPATLKFHNFLRGMGITVDTKPLKFINGDELKPANKMDGDLMLTAFQEHTQWDKLILFAGDCDYERLVKDMIKLAKPVHIYSYKNRLSKELKVLAFSSPYVSFTYLDDLKTAILKTAIMRNQ